MPAGSTSGTDRFTEHLSNQLDEIRKVGLFKSERVLTTPQHPHAAVADGRAVLNLCANNYLGLADHPAIVAAAKEALDRWGYGMSSVRFICGTQELHKQLEAKISDLLRTDDTILYAACWDANGGLFETVLGPDDAIISDELNHASIIDGVRLCKAQRHRYRNNDMADLEAKLKESSGARFRMIATDGVFSMDGVIANLPAICELADRYDALVMVDDSHAAGFIGKGGGGTPEFHNVIGRIDILTGTLGKALGGGAGGYTSGRGPIISMLRQRSRPYLFSNSLPPPIVGASIKAVEMVANSSELRRKLDENTVFFRSAMSAAGFNIAPGTHPIVPIMIGEAPAAVKLAERMLDKGIYVIAFSFPVVPQGKARIRIQMSAAHTREDLEFATAAFAEAKRELNM